MFLSQDEGESRRILLSYGEKIRYFYKANGGVADALNYGLSKVNGAYVARMDADDIYNSIAHPSVMLRREVFDQGWRYDESAAAEDYDLWTRMIPAIKFYNLRETLLFYRLSAENITVAQSSEYTLDVDLGIFGRQ